MMLEKDENNGDGFKSWRKLRMARELPHLAWMLVRASTYLAWMRRIGGICFIFNTGVPCQVLMENPKLYIFSA